MLFITICDKIVFSGFAISLIPKKDADNKDFSTVFFFSLAAVATPLLTVLLTGKWLPNVFFLLIISISFAFSPIEIENLQTIKVIGRSDLVLKLEVVKRIFGVDLLIAAIPFGVKMIAVSLLVSNVLSVQSRHFSTES